MAPTKLLRRLAPLALCAPTLAYGPIPAVDLPPLVPESVRDSTARSLALARDTLGWAVHPFRGEFHGLGSRAGGLSVAYDLSANGRVVVGANYEDDGASQAFVWSPWTGNATYAMAPTGAAGSTVATAISADGVYVGGEVARPGEFLRGFRWSLAGREPIAPPTGYGAHVNAISGDGGITVGTLGLQFKTSLPPDPAFAFDPADDDGPGGDGDGEFSSVDLFTSSETEGFRFSRSEGLRSLDLLPVYGSSAAVDVSSNGGTILGNTYRFFIPDIGGAYRRAEPVLFVDGVIEDLGGLPLDAITPQPRDSVSYQVDTTANAISADGRVVVGVETHAVRSDGSDTFRKVRNYAVRWTEGSGWMDLGELPTLFPIPIRWRRSGRCFGRWIGRCRRRGVAKTVFRVRLRGR